MSTSSLSSAAAAMAVQNTAALDYFIHLPVSREMVRHLAYKASEVISCERPEQTKANDVPPTPPSTPPADESFGTEPAIPTVEAFIVNLVQQSHVQVPTLMTSLVYLARLKARLPAQAQGMRCSVHRIFLAALILAAKNLNDSSPKNKHWARYTWVPGFDHFGFSTSEVNLMEKQLLYLLEWDMRVNEDDLFTHLEPFLIPIRAWQQREAERKLVAERNARERQIMLHTAQLPSLTRVPRARSTHHPFDSPASNASASSYDLRTHARTLQSSRSSSRLPLRTPSLSPPTRAMSVASSGYAESVESTPASPVCVETCEPVAVYDVEMPSLVQIQPARKTPRTLPFEIEKPAKRAKTASGNIFSRILGSAGFYSRLPQQQHQQQYQQHTLPTTGA